jgi:hypothetical protein
MKPSLSLVQAGNHKNQSGVYVKQSSRRIAKLYFITSTFPKEGKTFVQQIWRPLLLYQVKVLLIGMDIRTLDWRYLNYRTCYKLFVFQGFENGGPYHQI